MQCVVSHLPDKLDAIMAKSIARNAYSSPNGPEHRCLIVLRGTAWFWKERKKIRRQLITNSRDVPFLLNSSHINLYRYADALMSIITEQRVANAIDDEEKRRRHSS